MSVNRRTEITKLLTKHPDGLTRAEMAKIFKVDLERVSDAVRRMPNVYVDRWKATKKGFEKASYTWTPVYCLVSKPEDAPYPDRKPTESDYDN